MIGHRTAQEVSNSTTDNRDDQGMSSSNFVGHDTEHEASDHQPHHEHLVDDDGPVVVSTNEIIFLSNCGVHVKRFIGKLCSPFTFQRFGGGKGAASIRLGCRLVILAVVRLVGPPTREYLRHVVPRHREVEGVPVALVLAPELWGRHHGEGRDQDVDAGAHCGQPQQEGVPLLPRPELAELREDPVVVHGGWGAGHD